MTARPLTPRTALTSGAVLLTLTAVLTGCASADVGPRTTEERDVADVTAVQLQTHGTLTVERAEPGAQPSLTVTAGERMIDGLTSEVRDGVLVLGSEHRFAWGPTSPVQYRLVVDGLEGVAVDGSGSVSLDAASGDRLDVTIRGSGDVEVGEVDVDEVAVQVSGSGDVRLSGAARTGRVVIEGSGDVDARWLTVDEAAVVVRGSGDVGVDVSDTLDVRIDGSGGVTYTGDARVTQQVNGSGSVGPG